MMPSLAVPPGPLELLVLQPTPFCNINCSYCYLPDRQSTKRMTRATLETALEWVFASGLVQVPFTVLWHAGEPLVVPVAFYDDAADLIDRFNSTGLPIQQSFQTNATLITEEWCDYFLRRQIHLGVSVDGPAFLHDRCRKTRQGQGTLERVLQGIRRLHERQVPFDVITVLTANSLDCPDELFDFYLENGIARVAFNVEEIEGPNITSSLLAQGTEARFARFLERFMDLAGSVDPPLSVREFEISANAIRHSRPGCGSRAQENRPWAILNIDCEGNFCTYSPELLGLTSPRHGSFALGNVARDRLPEVIASKHFQMLEAEISRGVGMCRDTCSYFDFCLGGAPGNKFFENGTFASTETLSCRLHKKVSIDVTLNLLEQQIPMNEPRTK